jgi:hypothetical protein
MEEESSFHNIDLNKKNYLSMEAESSFQIVDGNKKNRPMDNIQNVNNCVNIP